MADITDAFRQAVQQHQAGDLTGAEQAYRAILAEQPNHAATLCNLGALLATRGEFAEAAQCYQLCLASSPGYPDAHYNFGNLFRRQGQFPEAIQQYEACLRGQPKHIGARFNLGMILVNQGDLERAEGCFQSIIEAEPDYADAHNRLGDVHLRAGRADAAVKAFERYLVLRPGDHRGYHNLGLAYANLGQPAAALEQLHRALELKPDYPDAFNTMGLAYEQLDRKDDAEDCYRRAVACNPEFADAWSNLGTNLTEAGRADEAIEALRRSAAIRRNTGPIASNLLLTLNYTSRLTPEQVRDEHFHWAEPFNALAPPATSRRDPRADRILRLGYISGDFRSHTVAGFIETLLQHHNRNEFSVSLYSNVLRPDDTTDRMKRLADRFRSIVTLSDAAAADAIRADEIDILIDLSGHTAGNRLEVLARKPAPLQATLFGYPNTTGLRAVDYRITDAIADPPGMTESLYAEQLLRLSGPAWVYAPPADAPPLTPLPALQQSVLTFGCLNNAAKISEQCLATWSRLLAAIPDSRIILLAGQSRRGAERLAHRFEAEGVQRERIEFVFRMPPGDYFRTYSRMDLGLDPFPYNGGVTTCDALWMGLPVLTIAGPSYVSRQGASILTHAGLSEFIADNPEQFIDLARTWAVNRPWLAEIRNGLRLQLAKSPMANGPAYVRNLEQALREAWVRAL